MVKVKLYSMMDLSFIACDMLYLDTRCQIEKLTSNAAALTIINGEISGLWHILLERIRDL